MTTATSQTFIQPVDFLNATTAGLAAGEDRVRVAGAEPSGVPAGGECAGMRLADLATGVEARVLGISTVDTVASADIGRRLAELGFLPGERLRIVARGSFGREPIAVRIGTGTFGLRLFEAACIRVSQEPQQAR